MTHDIKHTARIIEALIFASTEPVARHRLEKHLACGVSLDSVLALIAARYGVDSGIELRQVGTAWALRTKADIASHLKIEKTTQKPLSRAALETLAIIAYHQPVTRAEIEEIRGVGLSAGTIDILLAHDWIKIRGRKHTLGRPLLWGTTPHFLDHFGLDSLDSLPGVEELKQAGLGSSGSRAAPDYIPEIATISETRAAHSNSFAPDTDSEEEA